MRGQVLLVLGILSLCTPCQAQIKVPTQRFQELLRTGKYTTLFNEARKLREREYGKCAMVDYFIGKCLCGSGKTDVASVWYSNILKNYKGMSAPQKTLITDAKKNCQSEASSGVRTTERTVDMSAYISAVNAEGPSAGVSGKLGMVYKPCQTAPQPVGITREVGAEEMESRLFKTDQAQQAVAKYRSLLSDDPNYKVMAKRRYILITYESSNLNDEEAEEVCKKLDIAYQFFISTFGLRPPDKLLAVYLLPERSDDYSGGQTPNMLQKTAERVHGIKIPDENIGYSNIKDLSLLGIASPSRIGTLFHELMHLMIRTDIGDVPAWMDEGLACIYETSIIDGDKLSGNVNNWRTSVLEKETHKQKSNIPRLSEFLNYSWSKFDGIDDGDICQTAINYAYAKHLLLYLQQQNQLKPVFNALKNRSVLNSQGVVSLKTDVQIFEETLDASIDTIEQQFDAWIKTSYDFSLYEADPAINTETFLEIWNQYSQSADRFRRQEENEARKESWKEIVDRLASLKSRYDKLSPEPQAEQEGQVQEQQMVEQQMVEQQVVQTTINELKEDHYTIAKREKNMPGISTLKEELQEVVKQHDLLMQQ